MSSSGHGSDGTSCCRTPQINCCKNLQNISLKGLKEEFRQQFKYIWSSVLFNITIFTIMVIPLLFCGRLGNLEFASASLASSMINTLCVSVANGLTTACDTFFAQMYGSSNKKNIFALPILAIIPNMESMLIAMNVQPEIARLSGVFIIYFMPAVPAVICNGVFVKYLQNTDHLLPVVGCTLTANGFSALLCYIFIYHLDLGIRGPAIAMMLSYYILLFSLVSYIVISKMYIGTWNGWSRACLYDWGTFASLAISGMLHVCLEWWGFEIGYFMAGILGKTQLGAFSITVQVGALTYMIPLGLSIAASIRIGHSLGSKDANGARTAIYVALLSSWFCAFFVYGVIISTKQHIAKVFINDPDIINLVAQVMPLFVIYGFFDYTGAVCNGGLRGSGHQKLGAGLNLICFYIIILPIGGCLMFVAGLGIIGLWTGIMIGLIIQGTSLFTIIMNLDWDLEVHKAQIRAGAAVRARVNSCIKEGEESETEHLNNGHCVVAREVEENETELHDLPTDTSDNKHSTDESEREKRKALMNDERSGDEVKSKNVESFTDDDDVRLVHGDIKYIVLKRVLILLFGIVIFVVGFSLSFVFRPSYCEPFDGVNATLNSEYDYYDNSDDCIQL